uniref:RelB antitoxin n=1 Tax=Candidatus Kentrum sp. DK TaxID=2126562 RepID=A0A450TH09_9GAMM|nr:MAG: RelB antitoxin [Candidatus Kentron sp. DK]
MNKTTMVQAELAPGLKKRAEEIFRHMDLDAAQAITLFYREVEFRGGFPFDIAAPKPPIKRTLPSFQAEADPVKKQPESSSRQPEDPIIRARGLLKDKKGGTALFMRDKREEIEKEYRP